MPARSSSKPATSKPAVRGPVALIEQVTFAREFRCFAEGQQFHLRKGVNLLVGDQGSGKSSLLSILRDLTASWDRDRDFARDTVSVKLAPAGQGGVKLIGFDFENDNPRIKGHFPLEPKRGEIEFQLQSKFRSHGQVGRSVLDGMAAGLLKRGAARCVILLDEPDMALSPRSVRHLADTLQKIGRRHQVICSAHNPLLIASQADVLSVEHGRWMPSSEFLDAHAED